MQLEPLPPPPDIDEINTIFHKLNKQPATLHVGYSLMIRTNSRACVERGHNNGRGRRNGKLHASRRTAHSLKTEWEAARVRAQTWYLCSRKAEEKKQQQTPPENIILIHTAQKQPLVFSFCFVVFWGFFSIFFFEQFPYIPGSVRKDPRSNRFNQTFGASEDDLWCRPTSCAFVCFLKSMMPSFHQSR